MEMTLRWYGTGFDSVTFDLFTAFEAEMKENLHSICNSTIRYDRMKIERGDYP